MSICFRRLVAAGSFRTTSLFAALVLALGVTGLLVSACGGDDSGPSGGTGGMAGAPGAGGDGGAAVEIPEDAEFQTVEEPVELSLRLNRVVYQDGEGIEVVLDLADLDPEADELAVALTSTGSGDVEVVELERDAGNRFVSVSEVELEIAGDEAEVDARDGILTASADELFYALFALSEDIDAFEDAPVGVLFDFGMAAESLLDVDEFVIDELALSDDEEDSPKPVATLLKADGYPVQVATHELLAWPSSEDELERLLERTGGTERNRIEGDADGERPIVVVELDPSQANTEALDQLRGLYEDTGDLFASREEGLAIYALVLELQLDGFIVALNPRLQMQGAPSLGEPEASQLTHTMQMVRATGVGSGDCVPGDSTRPCVQNVPALWAFQDIFDKDETTIQAGVLDIGFAPNDDFRQSDEDWVECDMSVSESPGYSCGEGEALGPPTVGNSFFGDRSWHGTGVVTTLGGVVHNDFGAAGVAGQVAVPMLYKYDFAAYAFEIGQGIALATSQGASCINVSGGYPCRMLTNVGPDFNICTPGGRAGICAIVTAGAHAAAATTCATLGPIPIVGGAICAAAIGGAVAVTDACIATLAFGDLTGPIYRGVSTAERQGVPVITIAGNRLDPEALPPVVRDLVDVGNVVTEDWGIVPAMHPATIVVGAVDDELGNAHFVGDRVDIWAPIRSAYMAPESVDDPESDLVLTDIGGTSAAAPFITGVVAAMQAANPELDPNSGEGDASEIVAEIKRLLLANGNTFSNDELADFGYADEPARRKLVDPLAAVRAAAEAYDVPDLEALGYDLSLNYSELLSADDSADSARPLTPGTMATGTIYAVADEGDTLTPDVDWYSIEAPDSGVQAYQANLALTYPEGFDALTLAGDGVRLISSGGGAEVQQVYVTVLDPGAMSTVRVQAGADADNVYKLELDYEPAAYSIEILSPGQDSTVCANTSIELEARASYTWDDTLLIGNSQLEWFEGTNLLATGLNPVVSFAQGAHTLDLVPFGDTDRAASVSFSAEDCQGEPPTVTISVPAGDLTGASGLTYDGFDEAMGMYYVDVQLTGSGTDPEDGALPGSALSWYTDQTDLQPALLGSGTSITARLYSDDCFGITHTIRLEGVDSDENSATPKFVRIFASTLC